MRWLAAAVLAMVAATPGVAREPAASAVRIDITSRITAFDGRRFGPVGAYERIAGVARLRIDPRAPANRGIADLDRAPRAADGKVDYDVDVVILRPKDPARARRVLLYDVVNRGFKLAMSYTAARGISGDPIDPGDGLLLSQGYTLVWSGWQGDIDRPGFVGARFPVARGARGRPLTGPVSTETIFENLTSSRMTLPFAPATLDQRKARLTVRATSNAPLLTLPSASWRYDGEGAVVLQRPAGFDAGAIYRFEYQARDPKVMGLGFSATRDLIAFLRHGGTGNPLADLAAAPCERNAGGACVNPQGGVFSTAVAIGSSQSGRYLRDFLWQGFNRDLTGKPVFDGVIPFIPGARRTFTNFRFAEPGRFSRQHEDHGVPGFDFPFAYATLRDPVTGRTDGILASCTRSGTCPKVFHVDTSAEFWQAGSGLIGTGGTTRDVPFPPNVRAYMIAGASHAPGMTMPACRYPANPFNPAPMVRALVLAMVDWAGGRAEPPDSRWPSLARGELVPLDRLSAPAIPGVDWARVANRPEPPAGRPAWPLLVPSVDADGIDRAGIRLPEIAAPLGTYLGWNLRKAGYGEGDLCLLAGSLLPFARDAAARGSDPRLAITERYPTDESRARTQRAAAEALVRNRLLLPEDLAAYPR